MRSTGKAMVRNNNDIRPSEREEKNVAYQHGIEVSDMLEEMQVMIQDVMSSP
jgi:hypothetical protein